MKCVYSIRKWKAAVLKSHDEDLPECTASDIRNPRKVVSRLRLLENKRGENEVKAKTDDMYRLGMFTRCSCRRRVDESNNTSCLVMTPLPSSSKIMKANLSLSSLLAPAKLVRDIMNSLTSICPERSTSNSWNSPSHCGDGSTCGCPSRQT